MSNRVAPEGGPRARPERVRCGCATASGRGCQAAAGPAVRLTGDRALGVPAGAVARPRKGATVPLDREVQRDRDWPLDSRGDWRRAVLSGLAGGRRTVNRPILGIRPVVTSRLWLPAATRVPASGRQLVASRRTVDRSRLPRPPPYGL